MMPEHGYMVPGWILDTLTSNLLISAQDYWLSLLLDSWGISMQGFFTSQTYSPFVILEFVCLSVWVCASHALLRMHNYDVHMVNVASFWGFLIDRNARLSTRRLASTCHLCSWKEKSGMQCWPLRTMCSLSTKSWGTVACRMWCRPTTWVQKAQLVL